MYQIKLEQFNGPLDLLLCLIEDEKLDISQVSLAKVTDQYLSYIERSENISATELADFLVIATKLLVIKSKTLLPDLVDGEEDSAEQLEEQLRIYKDYLEASKKLATMIARENFCFSREKIASQLEPTFSPPAKLTKNVLAEVFSEILSRVSYVVNLPEKVMEKAVTLKEMVGAIKDALANFKKINFQEIISQAKSRTEKVVCFVALLELIKKGEVAVTQGGVFDEIMVEKAGQVF